MASRESQGQTDEVQAIRELLRGASLRCTPARISVMLQLRAATSPLTHADIAETLVPLGFDKATVFRNLTDLTEAGLVSRTELGDHVWRFEQRDPTAAEDEHHPHFVCITCGSVTCLGEMEFTPASRKRSSDIGRITEILIKGQCVSCQQSH